MKKTEKIECLVDQFAVAVMMQTDAIHQGDHLSSNAYARRYISAFKKLRCCGDAGREALASLFTHPRSDVRVMAAAFLLRHKTRESLDLLKREAAGQGIVPFGASEAIKRWEEGNWSLDPIGAPW